MFVDDVVVAVAGVALAHAIMVVLAVFISSAIITTVASVAKHVSLLTFLYGPLLVLAACHYYLCVCHSYFCCSYCR